MKRCLSCTAKFDQSGWSCPECGYNPEIYKDYLCFAPDLAKENMGFKDTYFTSLFALEDQNFWFTSRNHLIVWILKKFFPSARVLLEIGCGTGFVLSGIQKAYPDLILNGSEIFVDGLDFASQRLNSAKLFQMDARKIPFDCEFDIIGAFDVLEHIPEDDLVLSEAFRAINWGGGIIITVPQHPFMWSITDELACHVRRYTIEELRIKVERAGFRVERITSFVSLLFPLMLLSRLRSEIKKANYDPGEELKMNPLLNKVMYNILRFERLFIKSGVSFPFGGSLLLVGRKV